MASALPPTRLVHRRAEPMGKGRGISGKGIKPGCLPPIHKGCVDLVSANPMEPPVLLGGILVQRDAAAGPVGELHRWRASNSKTT